MEKPIKQVYDVPSSQTSLDPNGIHSSLATGRTNDPDLPLKYTKLLAEFSKIRSQLNTVSKAYTEELVSVKTLREQVHESNKLIGVLQNEIETLKSAKSEVTSNGGTSRFFLSLDETPSGDGIVDGQLNKLKKEINSLKESNEQLSKEKLDVELVVQTQKEIIHQQRLMIDSLSSVEKCPSESPPVTVKMEPEEKETWLWKRLQEMTNHVELANSKVKLFSEECHRLKQRLIISNEAKESSDEEVVEYRNIIQSLKDELSTSVRNYESQLEAMSDHLATMNEKWSRTQIEMDSLKQLAGANGKQVTRQSSKSSIKGPSNDPSRH